ncbi:uncharacterized protein VK521_016454 [Ammospiza maritima maritima]
MSYISVIPPRGGAVTGLCGSDDGMNLTAPPPADCRGFGTVPAGAAAAPGVVLKKAEPELVSPITSLPAPPACTVAATSPCSAATVPAHLVDNLTEGDKECLKKKLPLILQPLLLQLRGHSKAVDRAVTRRYQMAKELIDTVEVLSTFHIKGPNPETMNELFSKLYKEAEKIKHWKLTVETELNQKERKLQENRKIIEAQKKAIQELQIENEKLHLKLEDEICENKDLLEEAAASRHLCNLLKETCIRFTEKTSKYEQEKEATIQLYEELRSNIERMTLAFEELRVQAENDRLEMSFKLKEEAVENMRLLCDETAMIRRETDTKCQHKKTEMVTLMEKHKNEYDKMVEEKDAELKVYKMKQQKQFSSERALENELSCLKRELSSLKEQLRAEMEEKENLVKEHSGSVIPDSEKKHKTCVIKTPPVDKMQSGRSTNLPAEQSIRKKQKVLVQLDTESDSSEHTDLLVRAREQIMC